MRHIDIVIPSTWLLTEAVKARIDHPEDLVFDHGSSGARKALGALIHASETPHNVTVKWDGSPALIFGRDDRGFTLVDKSGFASRKMELPRSASELNSMLYMRKPDEPGRQQYAGSIAKLWDKLEKVVPTSFRGFIQGDLLWSDRPPVDQQYYRFKPNKVSYAIPASSPLGQLIGRSSAGMAVHGLYSSREDSEPAAIDDPDSMGLMDSPDVVIMGSQVSDLEKTSLPKALLTKMHSTMDRLSPGIDRFLDRQQLSARQITDLPDQMKRYVNSRAYAGHHGLSDAPAGFVRWIESGSAGLTERKRANVLKWISEHGKEHAETWMAVDLLTTLKDRIKKDIDRQVTSRISAELHGAPGHEGYVADTPFGRIKMVNRPHFMKKEA